MTPSELRPCRAVADDAHAVGGEDDRLVLLVPAHAVSLVTRLSEDLDDLAATNGLAGTPQALSPSPTCASTWLCFVVMGALR